MSTDLRRTIARAEVERQRRPRSKWAPGSWAKAAAYNATKPEVRSPVIVGGDSMIRRPEELRDRCNLPSVPPLSETTETALFPYPEDHESNQGKKETLYIADVSLTQWLDLADRTEGEMVVVWFHGQRRYAWLARSQKAGGGDAKA
ncbi:hypothetical protein N658DRAFT_204682 [Parathielavia hyrcaniae]|uniref:Uncharacterized protein n=1 Tax=Parathielavia hyrcaniae TaxID=113614 RepID=A0AAN6SZT9_9PEZI|nr:hypothetical protein N658DRAFT_204682 [Parathielavia hyrcaniae]